MNAYRDYMDNITADAQLQEKTLDKLVAVLNGQRRTSSLGKSAKKPLLFRLAPAWARAACFALLICIALGATAYAVLQHILWEPTEGIIDTGAQFVIVPQENQPPAHNAEHTLPAGIEAGVVYSSKTIYVKNSTEPLPIINEANAQILRELLAGVVFTVEGEPFDLLIQVVGGYQADDRGIALHDRENMELIGISFRYQYGDEDEKPLFITTWNIGDEERGYREDSYDEAAVFLGGDFRLPTVHTEHLNPPMFQIITDGSQGMGGGYVAVSIIGSNPSICYEVYPKRNAGDHAMEIYRTGGIASEGLIEGVIVYKLENDGGITAGYMWEFEDMTYYLTHWRWAPEDFNDPFTDEQIEEIIRSMVE